MVNPTFLGQTFDQSASGYDCFTVTPHDATNFTQGARALYVGTGGTVVVVTPYGNVVSWTVSDGAYIMCSAVRVNATGTTATNIIGIV